jgi:hypothetical protein
MYSVTCGNYVRYFSGAGPLATGGAVSWWLFMELCSMPTAQQCPAVAGILAWGSEVYVYGVGVKIRVDSKSGPALFEQEMQNILEFLTCSVRRRRVMIRLGLCPASNTKPVNRKAACCHLCYWGVGELAILLSVSSPTLTQETWQTKNLHIPNIATMKMMGMQ